MKERIWILSMVVSGAIVGLGCAEDAAPGPAEPVAPAAVTPAPAKAPPTRTLSPNTKFMIRLPDQAAVNQIASTLKGRDLIDSLRLGVMAATPQAVWFTNGTPQQVQTNVHKTMLQATLGNTVPVLVAYNVPYRDCAQYSAGGAADTASYEAWIDGFAAGIGTQQQAVVILEPDSLGIIPWYTSYWNSDPDWCQPMITDGSGNSVQDPNATPAARFAQLNYAIASIHAKAPGAIVYLDATHSAWLGANEAAHRLIQGGINSADGFFSNVSNYQPTSDSIHFGTWVSECLALINGYAAGGQAWWDASWGCPNQYVQNSSGVYVPSYTDANVAAVDAAFAADLAPGWIGPWTATTHFVVDTSRNGRGALDPSSYASAPYNQSASVIQALTDGNWCNPPGAGLGPRPTANTGVALFDAELWVKTPGESDGACASAKVGQAKPPRAWDYTAYDPWGLTSAAAESQFDPLWGMVDPAAGVWFPQTALQLAQNATPPLL
jgi:endoglucanase